MSFQCIKCIEAWEFEDYQCPCCGSATVDPNSYMEPTLKYKFTKDKKTGQTNYDVIRIANKKSVFDEAGNPWN